MAQDLTPRSYVIVMTLSYSRLQGDLQFDGAVPITDATAHASLAMFSYYRSLDLFGRTASITFGLPYGVGDFKGTVVDAPKSAHLSGLFDTFVRLSLNLIGGPAAERAEFPKWRQTTVLGVSLRIVGPGWAAPPAPAPRGECKFRRYCRTRPCESMRIAGWARPTTMPRERQVGATSR